MLLLLLVVQFTLWAHAAQTVQLAASDGDRTATSFGGSSSLGAAQARSILGGNGSDVFSSSVSVTVLPGDLVLITVTGHADTIFPGLSLPVSATQVGPIQEFRTSE
jgi:hypothetical protein